MPSELRKRKFCEHTAGASFLHPVGVITIDVFARADSAIVHFHHASIPGLPNNFRGKIDLVSGRPDTRRDFQLTRSISSVGDASLRNVSSSVSTLLGGSLAAMDFVRAFTLASSSRWSMVTMEGKRGKAPLSHDDTLQISVKTA